MGLASPEKEGLSGLPPFLSGIREDLDRVEAFLGGIGDSPNPLVADVQRYLFGQKGKRIRPALVILSARSFGDPGDGHILWSALIEIVHTASLVHDDIVDNAALRRGRDTVHARWGPNITVLLGDLLYIQSINLALKTGHREFIDILAEATGRMIEGELLEYAVSGKPDLAEDDYLDILDRKTASLFAAACLIGARLGGADKPLARRFQDYGRDLGLAFQIVDDLLDFTARQAELGKPVLSDLREGRLTLPLIRALRAAAPADRKRLAGWIEASRTDPEAAARVAARVRESGAIEAATGVAAGFAARAKSRLEGVPPSPHRDALLGLADYVLTRKS